MTQRRVRSAHVVVVPPCLDLGLRIIQTYKPFGIQTFFAHRNDGRAIVCSEEPVDFIENPKIDGGHVGGSLNVKNHRMCRIIALFQVAISSSQPHIGDCLAFDAALFRPSKDLMPP